jgi:hypothetical protein
VPTLIGMHTLPRVPVADAETVEWVPTGPGPDSVGGRIGVEVTRQDDVTWPVGDRFLQRPCGHDGLLAPFLVSEVEPRSRLPCGC